MAYHTLVVQVGTRWGIAFGDHDRETVEFEREDYRDRGWRARWIKIITTKTSRQSEIDAAVAALNAKQKRA